VREADVDEYCLQIMRAKVVLETYQRLCTMREE
jgi:hypothetical protein